MIYDEAHNSVQKGFHPAVKYFSQVATVLSSTLLPLSILLLGRKLA